MITAVETTPGSIAENHKLLDLVAQHEANTEQNVTVVVGDSKYGTAENLAACVEKNIAPHLGVLADQQKSQTERAGYYDETRFRYDAARDTYTCPAGQPLPRRRYHGPGPDLRVRGGRESVRGLSAAGPMHERQNGPDAATARPSRAGGLGQTDCAECRGAARPAAAAVVDGRELWPGGQRTRVQAQPVAAALAAGDPGLADRGGAECETAPAGGRKKPGERGGGGTNGAVGVARRRGPRRSLALTHRFLVRLQPPGTAQPRPLPLARPRRRVIWATRPPDAPPAEHP